VQQAGQARLSGQGLLPERPDASHTVFRNWSIRVVLKLQIPKMDLDLGILVVVVNRRGKETIREKMNDKLALLR
jgi:hypothetical protein